MKYLKNALAILLSLSLILGTAAGCSETLPPALSDGETENTEPENPDDLENLITPDEEEDDENPVYIVGQQMTLDLISEMNDGVMPEITYNDDGTIRRLEYFTYNSPKRGLSPFPVFTADDARTLIDMYLGIFGLGTDIDIRLIEERSRSTNLFDFDQYYNDIRFKGWGILVSADIETGNVNFIANGYMKDLDIETTPQISLEEAKQIAMSEFGQFGYTGTQTPELIIYHDREDNTFELIWSFSWGYMSAVTGEIIYEIENPSQSG
ncbi:MAG: hypothetical protein FWG70_00630 [Oscillospiraceae bacterium]|nr:hypothetical protein [Oscillospiraceae bacterium]